MASKRTRRSIFGRRTAPPPATPLTVAGPSSSAPKRAAPARAASAQPATAGTSRAPTTQPTYVNASTQTDAPLSPDIASTSASAAPAPTTLPALRSASAPAPRTTVPAPLTRNYTHASTQTTPATAPTTYYCNICHMHRPDEEPAALPCGHAFGHLCILQWLDVAPSPTCPLCRRLFQHACGHIAMPALAAAHPPFLVAGGPGLPAKCANCRLEPVDGGELVRLGIQVREAGRAAMVEMFEMPRGLGLGEREWRMESRLEEVTEAWKGTWEEGWMEAQKRGRSAW